jgi:hypothetical protein
MRRSDNLGEKSTERSLTPGSGLLKSGEQSIRSSLGEEVAKLMVPHMQCQTIFFLHAGLMNHQIPDYL